MLCVWVWLQRVERNPCYPTVLDIYAYPPNKGWKDMLEKRLLVCTLFLLHETEGQRERERGREQREIEREMDLLNYHTGTTFLPCGAIRDLVTIWYLGIGTAFQS